MGANGTRETTGSGCAFYNAAARYNFALGCVQVETDGGGEVEPHLGGARGWGRCQLERIGLERYGAVHRASDQWGWDGAENHTLWQSAWVCLLGNGQPEDGRQESPTADTRPCPEQQKWRTTGLAAGGGGDTVAEN